MSLVKIFKEKGWSLGNFIKIEDVEED